MTAARMTLEADMASQQALLEAARRTARDLAAAVGRLQGSPDDLAAVRALAEALTQRLDRLALQSSWSPVQAEAPITNYDPRQLTSDSADIPSHHRVQ